MKYWLYTWDYPGDGFEEWAIYKINKIWAEGGSNLARVKEIVIDKWNSLPVNDFDAFYDDAITEDPKRVIKFLFDQIFY